MKLLAAFTAVLFCLLLPAAAAEAPEAVYAKFHRAIAAGELEEMLRYATEAQRREVAAMSAAQKAAQLKMMSTLMPRAFLLKNKTFNPDGQRARLLVSGPGPLQAGEKPETLYGTINMVMQGGDWKVADVTWGNQPPAEQAQAAKPAANTSPAAAPPKSAAPVVGSMDSAPARKLGKQKPPCEFKPVMTAEDLENCK
jgi:hypothetical protein